MEPERSLLPFSPLAGQLGPLKARVLREQVRDAIRDAILSGELAAGSRLGEAETASALGVSRTPVREAIRELSQEGLLSFVPHRGAVVVAVHDDEIEAAYRIKRVLDEEAMARAAVRMTDGDFARLERLVADMEHVVRMNDFAAVADTDVRFHATIADVANFGLLRYVWKSVDDAGLLTSRQIVRDGRSAENYMENVAESHRALISALRSGDPNLAAQAARAHLLDAQERFQRDLE
jgi:DNA-binding GntR family transcriptional regulator